MAELETAEHLRLTPATLFTHYFQKRAESLAFYRRVRRRGVPPPTFTREYVVYHSWLPGFLEADAEAANSLRVRIDGASGAEFQADLAGELRMRGWCQAAGPVLDALVEKAFTVFPAIQNPKELRLFLDEVAKLHPRIVVEIGTGAGGLLYCLAQLAHRDAMLVSIDAPDGVASEGPDDQECELFRTFIGPKQQLHLIRDRSFHYSTMLDLAQLLDGRKIDLLFIDADHSYGGARSDFEMYREYTAPTGLIVFHDILMFPETWGRGFDVGIFWRELRDRYRTREIVDRDAPMRPPPIEKAARFGTPALGFGLLFQNGGE